MKILLRWMLIALLAGPALALGLTREQALTLLGREVLMPSAGSDAVVARMLPAPLSGGVVRPALGGAPVIDVAALGGNPQWFALVDLFPCGLFEHPVNYVFIDDVTGVVRSFPATDWPDIDGVPLGAAPGGTPLLVLPLLPRPAPVTPLANALAPLADYGDAPDGVLAYVGVPGRFPSFFATANSVLGRPGGHALVTGLEMLGRQVSAERDIRDPGDPDGMTNLRDADADERMFLVWDPNTLPATAHLLFDVTLAAGAPAGDRFVNALFDFDRDGDWGGAAAGVEWALRNQPVTVAPGTTATLLSPAFPWADAAHLPTQVWLRVALTRAPIDAAAFGAQGWDGSGAFAFGEIEDFQVLVRDCPPGPPEIPVPPDPGNLPPPVNPPPPPGQPNPPGGGGGPRPPGPPVGWNGQPVKQIALVIQGRDNPGQRIVQEAADTMENLLGARGYGVTRLRGAASSANDIANQLQNIKGMLVCQDRVLIYIIAHGANVAGGRIGLGSGENYTAAQLAGLLNMIEPCKDQRCDTPMKSCDVTVILESCHSGHWSGPLAGEGRRIITSSTAAQLSWSGSDGSGGEYSDRYAACTADPAADTNHDGFVSPTEAHHCASGRLRTPQPQTPGIRDQTCDCICPVDQLHIEPQGSNRVPAGGEGGVTATVQSQFRGAAGVKVTFEKVLGGFSFTTGTVTPDGGRSTVFTDLNGEAPVSFTAATPGFGLIRVSAVNTQLTAFYFFIITP